MKVKIIRNTVANKVPVFEGEIVELPEQEAKDLIAIGKAAPLSPSGDIPPNAREESANFEGEIETADLKKHLETSVKKAKK